MIYKEITIHVFESKAGLVEKNPHKRKVQKSELEALSKKTGGMLFNYDQSEKLDDVIERVITWKRKEPVVNSKSR